MLVVYCLLIAITSLYGGWLPSMLRMTHLRMQLTLSAVAGVMLGVATLHLLPHGARLMRSLEGAMWMVLAGVLFMFFLNRIFHFHQHSTAESQPKEPVPPGHEHCHHSHHSASAPALQATDVSSYGLLIGMLVHTLLDGVALGAAMASHGDATFSATGFSVFLAIALHKPLDAMSVTSLMAARGWTSSQISLVNVVIALTAPLGVLLFMFGVGSASEASSEIIGGVMCFAAGAFFCISLGDLLPEVHFHKHDRIRLSAALFLGLAVAIIVELLPGHSHAGPESNESPRDASLVD